MACIIGILGTKGYKQRKNFVKASSNPIRTFYLSLSVLSSLKLFSSKTHDSLVWYLIDFFLQQIGCNVVLIYVVTNLCQLKLAYARKILQNYLKLFFFHTYNFLMRWRLLFLRFWNWKWSRLKLEIPIYGLFQV